jgi:hypothetical protein
MASTTSTVDNNNVTNDFYKMVINEVKEAISVCPDMGSSHYLNPVVYHKILDGVNARGELVFLAIKG